MANVYDIPDRLAKIEKMLRLGWGESGSSQVPCFLAYATLFQQVPSMLCFKDCSVKVLDYLLSNYEIFQASEDFKSSKVVSSIAQPDETPVPIETPHNIQKKRRFRRMFNRGEEFSYTLVMDNKEVLISLTLHSGNREADIYVYYNPAIPFEDLEFVKLCGSHDKTSGEFSILVKDYDLNFRNYPINVPVIDDLDLNYGSGFTKMHKKVVSLLSSENSKGLFIFHGCPGTGKSTYIKLLSKQCDKKFLYIPEFMMDQLSTPAFMSLLIAEKNSIIVIEDADKIIAKRTESSQSMASVILNLTDGVLSDVLNIPIILTYNTETDNIDEALCRKGRLKMIHEFKPLSIQDSQKLIDTLDVDFTASKEMTVAEIFNISEDNNLKVPDKPKVGFI